MKETKLDTITNLFEGSEIRSIWNSEKEDYYFSIVDVISALTESNNSRNYWNMLKKRLTDDEKGELYTKCVQLKMKAKDGKFRETYELETGNSAISSDNVLGGRYSDNAIEYNNNV